VKNKRERSSPVRPLGVEKTSRPHSRDPVARWVKCGPHGGMNNKMKSWTVSWFSLKTKVEPGQRGSQVMSGDWQRLHRVRRVSGGSPENYWVPWLISQDRRTEDGAAAVPDRSNRWVPVRPVGSTGLTGVRRLSPETSKRRTRVGIAWLASRLRRVRSPGIRSMVKT
jgi:hypothetical protein